MKPTYGSEDLLSSAGRKALCGFLCAALSASAVPLVATALVQTWWESENGIPSRRVTSEGSADGLAYDASRVASERRSGGLSIPHEFQAFHVSSGVGGGGRGGDDAGRVGEEQGREEGDGGAEATDALRDVVIDATVPEVTCDYDAMRAARTSDGRQYFNVAQNLTVTVTDSHLDTEKTVLNGTPIAELVSLGDGAVDPKNPGITYVSWETMRNDQDEVTGYAVTMRFGDGAYELPLIDAVDRAGNHAAQEAPLWDGMELVAFTVDTSGPSATASLSAAPVRVVEDASTGRSVAFFDAPVTLKLRFHDEVSGIELVEDVPRYELSYVHDESGELAGVDLEIPEGAFADDVCVVVSDRACNKLVWSLSPEGTQTVSGVDEAVTNAPLMKEGSTELIASDGHPSFLVRDTTAPALELSGVEDGARVREAQTISLDVAEAFLGYATTYDPRQVVLSVSRNGEVLDGLARELSEYESLSPEGMSAVYRLEISADARTHADDGTYEVRARMHDLAGNESYGGEDIVRTFTIDTVAPELKVTFDDEETQNHAKEGRWFGARRTARISVRDESFSAEKLTEGGLVHVEPTAIDGHSVADVTVGAWYAGVIDHEYCCDVTFPADGTYSLKVYGADEAGNVFVGMTGTEADERGEYDSGVFVIDSTKPAVTWEYMPGMPVPSRHDGTDYFRQLVTVRYIVRDRNLDVSSVTVTDSEGREVVPDWNVYERGEDGEITYTATMAYREEEAATGSGRKAPRVRAMDLAGNATIDELPAFVVDQTAPELDEVRLSKSADAEGKDDPQTDPYQFFNEIDGIPATLTFVFSDEYLIETVWVEDPDGVYDVEQQGPYHTQTGSLTLALMDFEEAGAARDADFERNVRLYVRDVAGNVREWTCDRTGAIVADRVTSSANVSLDGKGVYPFALVKDTTAPLIMLSGVEEGKYYNTSQTEHIAVSEYNFDYLTRFDPGRTVVTVHKTEDVDEGTSSEWAIIASQFEGSSPHYAFDQTFESDGRYSIEATFDDFAGNSSQRVTVGEFTIDKTAPVLHVAWDNTDVYNAMYYHAPRVATITVIEHNFDQRLMSIETTGEVGGWSSRGDVHTCEVVFRNDVPASNPHRLAVKGSDRAGNEANPFVEPDFVIDTQAPVVSILKRVSEGERMEPGETVTELADGSAFSQAIVPLVEVADESNFDARGVEASLVGLREGGASVQGFLQRMQMVGDNTARVDWGNIGLVEDDDGPYYRLSADDVYTIVARATDLAGNVSEEVSVSFSVNRYGSNYFFEESGGLTRDENGSWSSTPLTSAPRVVVHEVNVSGALADEESTEECHTVTKEYANATTAIGRTQSEERSGYTLSSSKQASAINPYEGWSEYVYTIQPGNFGRGSDSDYGDGGQGTYRVDVSSRDKAKNNNTTAEYWGSGTTRTAESEGGESRADMPVDKTATVLFTLDEDGPSIEDVDVPEGLVVGGDYLASFRVMDQITNGDYVSVKVDGEPVEVHGEELSSPVLSETPVQQGTYTFEIPATNILSPREVEIHVGDYTGLEERSQTIRTAGFRLTTLVGEIVLILVGLATSIAAFFAVRRRRMASEPDIADVR